MRVFISYSHAQAAWVCDRLLPVLRAGGTEVDIDLERFEAGQSVVGQMDNVQDAADRNLIVLTPDYLASDYCVHEMRRACARDPQFQKGFVVPVKRANCKLTSEFCGSEPLYVDLCNDQAANQWDLLLKACDADLGCAVPDWLNAKHDIQRFLDRRQSVNLIVRGNVKWRPLVDGFRHTLARPGFSTVDLNDPRTTSRPELVALIIQKVCGQTICVTEKPRDLPQLQHAIGARALSYLALLHFDVVRDRHAEYHSDLYRSLRYLVTEEQKPLVLLIQSRTPFSQLLPQLRQEDSLDFLKTVELMERS